MSNAETFAGESGLIDAYIGTVEESHFAVAGMGMSAENFALHWKIKVDEVLDGTPPQNFDGYQKMRFGCGKGWASFDGGETVEDPNNPGRARFHRNSSYQKLIAQCAEMGMVPMLQSRGTAQEAKIWLGCKFKFELKTYKRDDGNGTYDVTEVVEFLGVDDGNNSTVSPAPVQAEVQAEIPGTEATAEAPTAAEGNGIDPALKVKLSAIKKSTDGHMTFLDKAMNDLPELLANDTLLTQLADENGLYAEL